MALARGTKRFFIFFFLLTLAYKKRLLISALLNTIFQFYSSTPKSILHPLLANLPFSLSHCTVKYLQGNREAPRQHFLFEIIAYLSRSISGLYISRHEMQFAVLHIATNLLASPLMGEVGEMALQKVGHLDICIQRDDCKGGHWLFSKRLAARAADIDRSRVGIVLLYLHGGGFWLPHAGRQLHGQLVSRLTHLLSEKMQGMCTDKLGMTYMIDYRLSPTHLFPSAIQDAVEAYRYLIEDLGISHEKIVIAGDSAGGNLCLALMQSIEKGLFTKKKLPQPAACGLLSPFCNFHRAVDECDYSRDRNVRGCYVSNESIWTSAHLYLYGLPGYIHQNMDEECLKVREAVEDLHKHPLVSPVYADWSAHLSFCDVLMQVGDHEAFHNEAIQLHRVVRNVYQRSSHQWSLEVYKGLTHIFQLQAGLISVGQLALDRMATFLVSRVSEKKTCELERERTDASTFYCGSRTREPSTAQLLMSRTMLHIESHEEVTNGEAKRGLKLEEDDWVEF